LEQQLFTRLDFLNAEPLDRFQPRWFNLVELPTFGCRNNLPRVRKFALHIFRPAGYEYILQDLSESLPQAC